jgi:serine/threonine-protein kinase
MSLEERLAEVLGAGYAIERELGGGMARLFLARDTALDRRVVVKVFEGVHDPNAVQRFLREIQFVAALQHPQIVGVIAAGQVDGAPYFIMPFVEGESVRHRLAAGPLPVRETVSILRDISRALAYAHERHIVHRDIKPDNILLAGASAVLTDFGVAKPLKAEPITRSDAAITQVGFTVGTPAYMAPEQVTGGALDGRTDLYALGMTAWEMLVGRAPFAGREAPAQMVAQINERPGDVGPLRADVPPGLARLIAQLVEKDIGKRPASAQALIDALEDPAVVSGVVTPGTVRTVVSEARRGRRRALIGVLGATLLLGAAGAAWALLSRSARAAPVAPSVAVMPWESAGAEGTDASVVEGIADELALALSRIPGVRVAPPAATVGATAAMGAQEIGRRLDVSTVLLGSGKLIGGDLRLSIQMLDARTGTLLWGNRFDGRMSDLFRMQDSIASAVAVAFKDKFGIGTVPSGLGGWGTRDPEAYEAFLRGRTLFRRRRAADLPSAIDALRSATQRDTSFARAFATLADAYSVLPNYGLMSQDSAATLAFAAVDRALALDPTLPVALAARGNLRTRAWLWSQAEPDLERAVRGDTASPQAWQWYGKLLLLTGRPDSAAAAFRRAARLDVSSSLSPAMASLALGAAGHTGAALAWSDTAVARDSSFVAPRLFRALVFLYAGRPADALVTLRNAAATGDLRHFMDGVQACALAAAGRQQEALSLVATLRSHSNERGAAGAMFHASVGLGDRDAALTWLEKAAVERDPIFINEPLYTPIYATIRNEPRFIAVMRQVGLTPAGR